MLFHYLKKKNVICHLPFTVPFYSRDFHNTYRFRSNPPCLSTATPSPTSCVFSLLNPPSTLGTWCCPCVTPLCDCTPQAVSLKNTDSPSPSGHQLIMNSFSAKDEILWVCPCPCCVFGWFTLVQVLCMQPQLLCVLMSSLCVLTSSLCVLMSSLCVLMYFRVFKK